MATTNKMVCVLGRTCAGKDSLTMRAIIDNDEDILFNPTSNKLKYELVVSYTTRPKRESEEDGVEHWFISEDDYLDDNKYSEKLAETEINGYHYFTTKDQIDKIISENKIPVYIIDPNGLDYLNRNYPNEYNIYTVYINTSFEEGLTRYIKRNSRTGVPSTEIIREYTNRVNSENNQFEQFEMDHKANITLMNETQEDFIYNKKILSCVFDLLAQTKK